MLRRIVPALLMLCVAAAFSGAVACGKKKPVIQTPPPPTPPPPVVDIRQPPPPAPPPPAPPPPVIDAPHVPTVAEIFAAKTVDALNKEGVLVDVYYEFDKADLSEASRTALQKNADFLKQPYTGNVMFTIEGHSDSRGTAEYNLALGERRAAAAKDYLVSLGIPATKITLVSKGKEQPFCTEENETCWALNRRGHFIITAK